MPKGSWRKSGQVTLRIEVDVPYGSWTDKERKGYGVDLLENFTEYNVEDVGEVHAWESPSGGTVISITIVVEGRGKIDT